MPDVAQFDNESAFSGGNHPWGLGKNAYPSHLILDVLEFRVEMISQPVSQQV